MTDSFKVILMNKFQKYRIPRGIWRKTKHKSRNQNKVINVIEKFMLSAIKMLSYLKMMKIIYSWIKFQFSFSVSKDEVLNFECTYGLICDTVWYEQLSLDPSVGLD